MPHVGNVERREPQDLFLRRPNGRTHFDGLWRAGSGRQERISYGRVPGASDFALLTETGCIVVIDGAMYEGHLSLAGQTIFWNDGDTWARLPASMLDRSADGASPEADSIDTEPITYALDAEDSRQPLCAPMHDELARQGGAVTAGQAALLSFQNTDEFAEFICRPAAFDALLESGLQPFHVFRSLWNKLRKGVIWMRNGDIWYEKVVYGCVMVIYDT